MLLLHVPSSRHRGLLAVVAITLLSGHVAPSVDDNNRYLKVTPLGDRVRLAYTVFFGQVPGATERRSIDANHDGQIDDAEAKAFADKIGAQVAALLDVDLDGAGQKVTWSIVDAGMGTPVVAAGAFSIDLVAYFCFVRPQGRHRLLVRDRFRVPRPGETEARVEDSPGVTIERAHVGPADDPSHDYLFAGPGGPLQDDGLEVVFTVGEHAVPGGDDACRAGPIAGEGGGGHGGHVGLWVGVAAAAVAAVLSLVLILRRRRS